MGDFRAVSLAAFVLVQPPLLAYADEPDAPNPPPEAKAPSPEPANEPAAAPMLTLPAVALVPQPSVVRGFEGVLWDKVMNTVLAKLNAELAATPAGELVSWGRISVGPGNNFAAGVGMPAGMLSLVGDTEGGLVGLLLSTGAVPGVSRASALFQLNGRSDPQPVTP